VITVTTCKRHLLRFVVSAAFPSYKHNNIQHFTQLNANHMFLARVLNQPNQPIARSKHKSTRPSSKLMGLIVQFTSHIGVK